MSDALDIQKGSKRDKALVTILERMVEQLHIQDSLIKELINRQDKISGAIEDSAFQRNLTRDEIDDGLKKLQDSFRRYRSDMLTFVREQDIIRDSMDSTLDNVNKIAYSLESTGQIVSKIEANVEKQNKTLYDNIVFTNKQWENLPQEFVDTNRNVSELHADIEKYFVQLRRETEKRFDKVQNETARRLLVLDKMMTALETLLIRTAPPEKRPFIFIRFFMIIGRFFKNFCATFCKRFGNFFKKTLPASFKKDK